MSIWSSQPSDITGYAQFQYGDDDLSFPLTVDVATALPWNDHIRFAAWAKDATSRGSTEMVLKPEDAKQLIKTLQAALDEVENRATILGEQTS